MSRMVPEQDQSMWAACELYRWISELDSAVLVLGGMDSTVLGSGDAAIACDDSRSRVQRELRTLTRDLRVLADDLAGREGKVGSAVTSTTTTSASERPSPRNGGGKAMGQSAHACSAELGMTRDPRAFIPGDPSAVRAVAMQWRRCAGLLHTLGSVWPAIEAVAADSATVELNPGAGAEILASMTAVIQTNVSLLLDFAAVLGQNQDAVAEAIRLWDRADAMEGSWPATTGAGLRPAGSG